MTHMPTRPRLRDVAERAGVSVTLVSSYLNAPHTVSARSRGVIQQAIDDLRFVPNGAARQLRRGASRFVGFVAYDIGDPLFVSVARGAQERAEQAGLRLVLADTDGRLDAERDYLSLFEEQQIRGLLLSAVGDCQAYLEEVSALGIPTVLIDQAVPGDRWPYVIVNDVLGGEMAVGHLLEIGRRRIAVVGGPPLLRQVADRIAGAHKAVAGVDGATLEVINTRERTVPAGREAGRQLSERHPSRRPDAVFCINDSMATGLVESLQAAGLQVPKDVAVIGYNDTAATLAAAPLSSIRQPHEDFGRIAIELLLGELGAAPPAPQRQVVLDPELVIRASTTG